MAADFTLVFRGTRHPKATVKAAGRKGFAITAAEEGKPWSTREALGFWRDFVELDLADEERVLHFARLRGLPFARPDTAMKRVEFTDRWPYLKDVLAGLAAAWEAPGFGFTDASEIVARQSSFSRSTPP